MEDQSLFNSQPKGGVSEDFRQFVLELVEEVGVKGGAFDEKKRWLRRFGEDEGVDCNILEKDLTDFFEVLQEWKQTKSKLGERMARMLGKECYLTEQDVVGLLQKLEGGNTAVVSATTPTQDASMMGESQSAEDEYISECIKEVCIKGDSLSKYQKIIEKKYGIEYYQKCEGFVEEVKRSADKKKFTNTSVTNLHYLARQIGVSDATVDAIVKHYTDKFEEEERQRQAAEKRKQEEARRRAEEEARRAREEAEHRAREEAERKAREEAERKAKEDAERKAREDRERKAKEEEERRRERERKEAEQREKERLEAERETSVIKYLDVDEDGNVFCTDNDIQGKLSIPSTLKGKRVSGIKENAFQYCRSLTSIVIPNSVTAIGCSAFEGCKSLTSIVIPNSVTAIKTGAFQYCESLTSIVIPNSVTEIKTGAFRYCESLTNIVIPNSVTKIGEDAFRECTGLTSIVIPDSVTEIGCSAFEGCKSLTSIVIPKSVMSIGSGLFKGCTELKSVKLSKGFKWKLLLRFPRHTELEYY